MQDLSGLEHQLRRITEQIEALHRPRDNEDIAALRKELADIGARVADAAPQRAIEALESEIRKLAERIVDSRQAGIDPAAIQNIEHGLAEVRDGLRDLRPAESLAGFESAIRNLSDRIDQMGASSQDPTFLKQLEAAIAALRGIVSHVASNDSLGKLAGEMQALSQKIDSVAAAPTSAGAVSGIEQRLAALSDQIKQSMSGNPAAAARRGAAEELHRAARSRRIDQRRAVCARHARGPHCPSCLEARRFRMQSSAS
ncbi:MAG: hypothetical protein M5U33_03220 [Pseudorhodoplanes sp.]|nr:hypothetical protein [Pseudorhodoplanes sp.]